jgi:hypothetical protein
MIPRVFSIDTCLEVRGLERFKTRVFFEDVFRAEVLMKYVICGFTGTIGGVMIFAEFRFFILLYSS